VENGRHAVIRNSPTACLCASRESSLLTAPGAATPDIRFGSSAAMRVVSRGIWQIRKGGTPSRCRMPRLRDLVAFYRFLHAVSAFILIYPKGFPTKSKTGDDE